MVYLVAYELKMPGMDYSALYSYLEKGDREQWNGIHVLRDVWWIRTGEDVTVDDICAKIRALIGQNDVFFVEGIGTRKINGWLASTSWAWYNNQQVNTNDKVD